MIGITPELQEIVYRALAKDVNSRYQSMAEVLADLEAVQPLLSSSPPLADPGSVTMTYAGLGHAAGQVSNKNAAKVSLKASGTAHFRKAVMMASQSALPQVQSARAQSSRLRIGAYILGGLIAVILLFLIVTPVRERLAGIFLSSSQKHIAVLPFENVSGDPRDAILVAGLIDSLSDRLSNLDAGNQSLWVVPGSEVRRLKIEDPEQALQKFGATLAVRGSVSKHGQSVQLDVDLIDTKNLRQIGSVQLEDANGDIGSLENQAVTRLARLMNLKTPAAGSQQGASSSDAGAYEDYLTALGYMQRFDKPGNLDQAITLLQKSIALDPKFAVSYAELGEAFRVKSSLTKDPKWLADAEANCRKSLQLNPDLPAAYVTLGGLHSNQERSLALQEFQHALSLDPHNASAEAGLGNVYEKMDRLPEAEAAYQKAVALQPEDWERYNALGNFYDRQNQHAEAIEQLKHAQQLTPDNSDVLINLASAEMDAGDSKLLPAAEALLKQAVSLAPSYAAYADLGQILSEEGRHAEAAEATERALSIDDKDYEVWVNLLNQYEWLDNPALADYARRRAATLLEQTIKTNPQDASAQAVLADFYAGLHDKAQTVNHIHTALALTPDDPQNLATIADAYENLGDRKSSLAYVQLALRKGYPLQQLKTDPEMRAVVPLIDPSSAQK
jgi:serine/threonine-protein kinase